MVKNTSWINFNCFNDKYGHLVPIEQERNIPFEIKRIYYIYSVDEGVRRGFHSHNELKQILICVHGSVRILVKTPFESQDILLEDPTKALYIGPMVWREMYDFSQDAVLLVIANEYYDIKDYIRSYADYEKTALNYFGRQGDMQDEHTICDPGSYACFHQE